MPDPLGSGLMWQQLLALGLVGTFVGAVKFIDALYQRSARQAGFDSPPSSPDGKR